MKGAFQTSREIFENPIWNDIPKFRIFFFIVGNAVFSREGIKKGDIHIGRGQFLRSYRNLRSDLEYIENRSVKKYSLSLIKRKVEQLVKEERLKAEDTELGTLFTVVNYALYQGLDNYKNNNENAERTNSERNENNSGTLREQTQNNNKNVKNVKNDKEDTHLQIENLRQRYSANQLNAIDEYFDMLRHTRKSAKISDSVILKIYQSFDKFPVICVEYGVRTHADNPAYHSKQEQYTLGIIRNTTAEEAATKLNASKKNNVVQLREEEPTLNEQIEEIDGLLKMGREYFKMNGKPEKYDELLEAREKLEQQL